MDRMLRDGEKLPLGWGEKSLTVKCYKKKFSHGEVYQAVMDNREFELFWYQDSAAAACRAKESLEIQDRLESEDGLREAVRTYRMAVKGKWPCQGILYPAVEGRYAPFFDVIDAKRRKNGEKICFEQVDALLESALGILKIYQCLEKNEYSCEAGYGEDFYIDVKKGSVLFAGAHNLAAKGVPSKEQVSLLMFCHFFHERSPYAGRKLIEKKFYSREEEEAYLKNFRVFFYDEKNTANRPVRGIHDKFMKYWASYPDFFCRAFQSSFAGGHTDIRFWENAIYRLKENYLVCGCSYRGFTRSFVETGEGHVRCPVCGKIFYRFSNEEKEIFLSEKTILHREYMTPGKGGGEIIGRVVENRNVRGVFGIKNYSRYAWMALQKDGKWKEIGKNAVCLIWPNLKIDFGDHVFWEVKGIR